VSGFKLINGNSGREIEGTFGDHHDPRTRMAALRDQVARDWRIQVQRKAGMREAVTNVEYAMLGLFHLRRELRDLRETSLPRLAFRASKAGRSHAAEGTAAYFMPPPGTFDDGTRLPAGRFNDVGARALYLATQEDILPAEMTQAGRPGQFCVASFRLDHVDGRFANLLPHSTKDLPHVNSLVGEAERSRPKDAIGTDGDPYPHTILLRHELEAHGFQGGSILQCSTTIKTILMVTTLSFSMHPCSSWLSRVAGRTMLTIGC